MCYRKTCFRFLSVSALVFSLTLVGCSKDEILDQYNNVVGGTSIERENGKDISVSCDLEITEGTAQVFWISGSDDPVILLEATDSYSETITLPEGGNYIGITGNNFTVALENKAAVFIWKIKMEWVKSGCK